jgi:hypothetical protein
MAYILALMLSGLPPNIVGDGRFESCHAPQPFVLQHPALHVERGVQRGFLTLSLTLVSPVRSSVDYQAALDRHGTSQAAFIALDDAHPLFLDLDPAKPLRLGFSGLKSGVHQLRYGVIYQRTLMNGGLVCISIP